MTKREIAVLSFKVLGLYAFIRVIDHLPYILYMYTLQALWTQARERLDVVTVIFANRAHRILQGELRQMGIAEPSPRAAAMLDLGDPDLDRVKLAEGMGVPGSRSRTAKEFAAQLQDAIRQAGPRLIEIVL